VEIVDLGAEISVPLFILYNSAFLLFLLWDSKNKTFDIKLLSGVMIKEVMAMKSSHRVFPREQNCW
jgi:hypothetical protein